MFLQGLPCRKAVLLGFWQAVQLHLHISWFEALLLLLLCPGTKFWCSGIKTARKL